MRLYLFLFALGVGGIFFFLGGDPDDQQVDPWSREGIVQQNRELLPWDGLVGRAASGGLDGHPVLADPFGPEELAGILAAVQASAGSSPQKLSHVGRYDKVPGQVLVVLRSEWTWSEEAAMAGGSGRNFYLEKVDGNWVVVDTSFWMS